MLGSDLIRLLHMLDAAREAIGFAEGKSRQDLDSDRMLTLAIVKSIEIIGEAAAKVTPETRNAAPDIPWPGIIGMRNRLIHAYFDVDLNRVWDTITDDLPPIITALEKAVSGKN